MYITFRGIKTFIEPNLPEMTMAEVEERLKKVVAAAEKEKRVLNITKIDNTDNS